MLNGLKEAEIFLLSNTLALLEYFIALVSKTQETLHIFFSFTEFH